MGLLLYSGVEGRRSPLGGREARGGHGAVLLLLSSMGLQELQLLQDLLTAPLRGEINELAHKCHYLVLQKGLELPDQSLLIHPVAAQICYDGALCHSHLPPETLMQHFIHLGQQGLEDLKEVLQMAFPDLRLQASHVGPWAPALQPPAHPGGCQLMDLRGVEDPSAKSHPLTTWS